MDARREELSRELKRARGWILGVGIMMFLVDTLLIQVVQKDQILPEWRTRIFIIDCVILAYFTTLWWFAKKHPKTCCILALVGFWGLQVANAVLSGDASTLVKNGIILKILFTTALINGLKSANRAQHLMQELGEVFA